MQNLRIPVMKLDSLTAQVLPAAQVWGVSIALLEWCNSSFCQYEGYVAIHTLKCISSICYAAGISKNVKLTGLLSYITLWKALP